MDNVLSEFEGLDVTEVGVEIPNAAGGLQDAMKFDPVEWHQGDEHFIVLRGIVTKIRHEPVDRELPDGEQRRVHVLSVKEAFPIEAGAVSDYVTTQRERIKKLKDEAEGTPALPLDGVEDGDLPLADPEAQADVVAAEDDKELATA